MWEGFASIFGILAGTLQTMCYYMSVIHKKASFTHTHAPTIDRSNFTAFRHFYAYKLYHSTKDLLFVKESLDTETFRTQWVYTRLVEWDQPDQWTVRRPITSKEEDELIEAEFEYVRFDDKLNVPIYRKRK